MDQPEAIEDGHRRYVSEKLIIPTCRQRRKVLGSQLNHPLIIASIIMRLLEKAGGEDLEFQLT
jgi:hypothetical protein